MRRSAFFTMAVLFMLVSLVACGGGNSSPSSPTPAPTPTRVIGLNGNLGFGDILVGSPKYSPLTISNGGSSMLTVTGLTGPTGYTASWTGGTIAPGASQVTNIGFAPTAPGVYNGTLTIVADHTSGTNSAAITGTAYANLNGGWSGSYSASAEGTSSGCNMTWIVSGQTGAGFSGTWQSSGAGCGQAGNLTGTISPSNAISDLNISANVAPSGCTWVSGEKMATGVYSGTTLTTQMTQTISCSGRNITRSITTVMRKQ